MKENIENRVCQNCKNAFTIESEDFSFYEKIKVPPPTFCPECRFQRRALWRNERTLYRRTCDMSGKSIVSIYSPDSRFKVYGLKEWWGDDWDPKDYGVDFDFSKPFFEQWKELQMKVPRLALQNKNNINSDFSNHSNNSKDCYMCTGAFNSENCMHSAHILPAKNSSDVYRAEGTSNENLFECINIHDCYNCQYCYLISNSFDCYYSFDLRNCSNCFLSYNLRGQSYCFMNQKYSKEEYFEKINQFNLKLYSARKELYKKWIDIIFNKALHRGTIIDSSVNCEGNFIFNSKNCKNSFESEKAENSKNIVLTADVTDSYDLYGGGLKGSQLYECHGVAINTANMKFCHLCYENFDLTYCDSCFNSKDLFGCVGVKKGSYMILNKQYSKEEYFELKEKIIEHMKTTGEWGQFFPPDLSPFGYNETKAQEYVSLSKEDALSSGFNWQDNVPGTIGKETIKPENLPDNIDDVDESIIGQVLACERTGRNYNITRQEYDFLKNHNIPIPRIHPNERYDSRVRIRPSIYLHETTCAISGEKVMTAYPRERRPKMVVSDEVYKKEVY